ncbi:MAG: hypothetical protein ABEI80_07160, partial [Haloplanus sp.]
MSRDVPNVVVFALVVAVAVGTVALPASALAGSGATADTDAATGVVAQTTANGTGTTGSGASASDESLEPGQQLAGVIGVQDAEIDGELKERTLATRVSRAESSPSKAAVVATELNQVRERLRTLRETQERLREARRSGELSRGEYRARMAITSAEIRTVRSMIVATEQVTRTLPAAALESKGVKRSEIDRLRRTADELRGPEIAEIAREIAGESAGRELAPGRG